MEITVCDIGSFNEKMLIEPGMTCKDLKEKIFSLYGRDTSNCTIVFKNITLDDHRKITPSSSIPYIILDQNIDQIKSRLDFNHSFYSSPRFSNIQQYNLVKHNQHFPILMNDRYFQFGGIDDSSDSEDLSDDNDIFTTTELFINDEEYNDNSDTENIITVTTSNNAVIDYETGNSDSSSDEYATTEFNENIFDFAYQDTDPSENNSNANHENASYFQPHEDIFTSSSIQDSNLHDFYLPHGSSTPPLLSSANLFPHQTDSISIRDSPFQHSEENNLLDHTDNYTNERLNIDLTPEENDTIRRICSENRRFDRLTIIQVFEACGRDVEATVQCLNTM